VEGRGERFGIKLERFEEKEKFKKKGRGEIVAYLGLGGKFIRNLSSSFRGGGEREARWSRTLGNRGRLKKLRNRKGARGEANLLLTNEALNYLFMRQGKGKKVDVRGLKAGCVREKSGK